MPRQAGLDRPGTLGGDCAAFRGGGLGDCDGDSKRGASEITLMLLSNVPPEYSFEERRHQFLKHLVHSENCAKYAKSIWPISSRSLPTMVSRCPIVAMRLPLPARRFYSIMAVVHTVGQAINTSGMGCKPSSTQWSTCLISEDTALRADRAAMRPAQSRSGQI